MPIKKKTTRKIIIDDDDESKTIDFDTTEKEEKDHSVILEYERVPKKKIRTKRTIVCTFFSWLSSLIKVTVFSLIMASITIPWPVCILLSLLVARVYPDEFKSALDYYSYRIRIILGLVIGLCLVGLILRVTKKLMDEGIHPNDF